MNNKKETPKIVCECPDCDNPRTLPLMDKDGKHNFVPHIIDGQQKSVCLACKMKLLQAAKQGRNGF